MKRYSISFWGVFLLASGSSGPDLIAKLEKSKFVGDDMSSPRATSSTKNNCRWTANWKFHGKTWVLL